MAYKILFVFFCATVLVSGEDKGYRYRQSSNRKPKFISFDKGKEDIEVSLDFNVPFLSIPIKNTVNSMFDGLPGLALPKINLNPSALAFGGFIILATSVLLPLFSKSFTYDSGHYYRDLENGGTEANILTDFTNQFMSVSSGCPPRIACWMSQRSDYQGPSKTVEQLIRNKIVSTVFNTTSIEEAISKGRRGYDCTSFEPCPIREEQMSMIMKNFGILTSRNFND